MKKALAIAVATLGLAACTKTETVYVPATEPATTAAPTTTLTTLPPSDYYNSTEQLFVGFVYDQYSGVIYISDQDLIDTGYAVCDALDAGVSPYAIVNEMVTAASGDDSTTLLLTIVTGGATGILCPEYAEVWSN